ncbi:hypothetical protein VOLCADRAFT_102646 [Volvox carteri f. nagariensis]|uniref:Uncharacterized protein n=1 Tax=Volvox carteri f. nagariensis TaxID=3068 RepID=D8TH88_VOLCA|nr:uncharacterized protein VOLCADRAFT_102646 [Volvox carteri f. nagariensis]EFJ53028.1 hypothetical protein VOLCADRAFT_102646 [Volvox carteri f. nagariensis]|eukprot:XP_002946033.1 hypothetical protein VOLCADRAFT_102646 [Volvox carteri f. nagariensis]
MAIKGHQGHPSLRKRAAVQIAQLVRAVAACDSDKAVPKGIASKMATSLLMSIVLIMIASYGSYAQGPQVYRGRARLFVADNLATNPAIVVIDLPGYNISQRIPLPGTVLQLGVSADNAHVGVFRNRDNNLQFFSVINTGIVPVLPAAGNRTAAPAPLKAGELGLMRPAFLAKSVILVNGSDAIGGVEGGQGLVYHDAWGLHLMYAENHGRVFAYRADDLNAVAAFRPNMTFLVPAGHFHAVPYGNFMLVPHANASKAFILDRTAKVVREYACAACDGTATYFANGSATAVFGCASSILVVRNTSATGVQIPVTNPRIEDFVDGVPGVFWSASSASQRFFWRTDVRAAAPRVTNVTHRGGVIRLASLPTQGRFVALHRDGFLVLYDGASGAALAEVQVRAGGFLANQTTPYLQTDVLGEHVFIAVPALGVVHSVHVDHGGHDHHNHQPGEVMDEPEPPSMVLERTLAVGGAPTSMTLAYMPGVVEFD